MTDTGEKSGVTIGVELTAGMLRGVVLAADGSVAEAIEAAVSEDGPLLQTVNLINQLKNMAPSATCVGVAVPGLVEMDSGRIALSRLSPEHENLDLANEISKATGLKANLENDANAAAYAEFRLGAGREAKDMFYVTLGRGVGGALILNGQLWHGAAGFAGEFGYVTINSEGLRVEDMASAANIVRRTRDRLHQDSTTSLQKLAEEELSLSDIVAAANAADDFAVMMLERTGMFVGTAVASVINLLNIERIVVGGEVMAAGEPVIKGLTERAREFSFAPSFAGTSILAGELGINAAAIGAALLSCT
jgi:glucokinase